MTDFTLIFCCALLLNVFATLRSSDVWKKWFAFAAATSSSGSNDSSSSLSTISLAASEDAKREQAKWQTLLRKYMLVYLLATLSDWLQGPYVYALYADYGYAQHDIAVLFVAGFGSSMIFGSFIGGMADWGGRRTFVLLFSLVYASSCLTKHFRNFHILMLGRLLGGVATSLLFSVFEAWLIRAHADAKLKHYLGKSFSWAAYGNSVIAICAGLVANKAASANNMTSLFTTGNKVFIDTDTSNTTAGVVYYGGYLNPFDIALLSLVLCGIACASLWEENYGDDGSSGSKDASNHHTSSSSRRDGKWYTGLQSAFVTTIRSQEVLLCGIISSLFEGSMYIFVFMWTPALQEVATQAEKDQDSNSLPFGLIFSTFMVCCMAGSSIFSIGIDYAKGESLGVVVFATAAVAMGTIALADNQQAKFVAMNLFECTVGMYWPIMGTLKGAIVPESKRAAIYNLYRIPLNFIVLFSLLTDLTPTLSFLLNCAMLSTATVLQLILMKLREKNGLTETESSSSSSSTATDSSGISLHSNSGGDLDEETQAMLKSSPEKKMDSAV